MPMKLFMMPQTVPNRPTNGAIAPMVARIPVPRSIRRPTPAPMRAKRAVMRSLMPSLSCLSGDRCNSSAAACINRPTCGLAAPAGRASASDAAATSIRCARVSRRRATASSSVLARAIAQVSTDADSRPSITPFTMLSAAMNMPNGVRSRGSSVPVTAVDAAWPICTGCAGASPELPDGATEGAGVVAVAFTASCDLGCARAATKGKKSISPTRQIRANFAPIGLSHGRRNAARTISYTFRNCSIAM